MCISLSHDLIGLPERLTELNQIKCLNYAWSIECIVLKNKSGGESVGVDGKSHELPD